MARERAKAGSKNCFPSPPDGLFFPVSLPRPLLRWKRLSRLISTGSHWYLSSQPARTLCPAVLPSHQQAPKHKVFFSLQLPLVGHCQGRGQAPESSWHPHESPSCSEPTWNPKLPTPTALAQGPRMQGHGNLAMTLQGRNSPKPSRRGASRGHLHPWGTWARQRMLRTWKECWGSTFPLLVQVEGTQEPRRFQSIGRNRES